MDLSRLLMSTKQMCDKVAKDEGKCDMWRWTTMHIGSNDTNNTKKKKAPKNTQKKAKNGQKHTKNGGGQIKAFFSI